MSVLVPSGLGGGQLGLRAYSDPVIFRDDRVLKTLLRKEAKYLPASSDYFNQLQEGLQPHMRKEVSHWMLEVCQAEQCQPEVFTLAMNYLDRFLSLCKITQSQLQLLGAVCLLVACKVRHQLQPLGANKLVEYSDFHLDIKNITEWEVLLLSKLDWDMSSVIALDFVEHIIQRVRELPLGWDPEMIRRHSETLVTMCAGHHSFYALAPSLVASACVLTTLRPLLEATQVQENTDQRLPSLNKALDIVEKIICIEKAEVEHCMENIEAIMKTSVVSTSPSQNVFGTPKKAEDKETEATPTKILDVAKNC